ncbi:MAG: imelysin family protein [Pseudomonadota bacterium]
MRIALVATVLALLPHAAVADVAEVVDGHILPGFDRFAEATAELSARAEAGCTGPEIEAAYHATFDAWLGVSHITFGPIEDQALTLSFAYWPDPRNQTGRALGRLIEDADPVVEDPPAYAEVSVAAQGFFALERLLFEPPVGAEVYTCALTRAIATTLAANAASVSDGWAGFATVVKTAGAEGNARFKSEEEAQRAVYTALSTGLEFIHDQRLARPLGTFDRPRPARAEARRSGRSLRNVEVSLRALQDLSQRFTDQPTPLLDTAYEAAFDRLETIDTPDFSGVAEPGKRLRIEALQVDVKEIQIESINEIGAAKGLSAGFNALDGD